MPRLIFESDLPLNPGRWPTRQLCYEGGDLIIALTSNPNEDLVLHSDILREHSAAFLGVTKDAWSAGAKTVEHPITKEDVKFYKYYLIHAEDKNIVLDTKAPASRTTLEHKIFNGRVKNFYLSNSATGFAARTADCRLVCDIHDVLQSRLEHKVIFGLLFQEPTDLETLTYTQIANITAYAEMYDILDFIAPALRTHLLLREDIWVDVRENCMFHLGLAIKLCCKEIYHDSLRHFIGSEDDLDDLARILDLDLESAFSIAKRRDKLRKQLISLTKEFQALTLTTYIPHSDRGDDHGRTVKTTYLSSRMDSTRFDQIQNIAKHIVMEWLNHQLCGEEHWSHVRKYRDFSTEVFTPSSLRNVCNVVTQACQTGSELELFGPGAAKLYVKNSDLQDPVYAEYYVEEELKKLCAQMSALTLPYIAAPDFRPVEDCETFEDKKAAEEGPRDAKETPLSRGSRRGRGGHCNCRGSGRRSRYNHDVDTRYTWSSRNFKHFARIGMTANNDEGCHYFTCVDFDDDEVPWDEDFEAYKLEGLEPASAAWMQAVKLADDLPAKVDGEQSLVDRMGQY